MAGAAGAALVAGMLLPTGAAANEPDESFGNAADYGVTPSSGAGKLVDGKLTGATAAPSSYFIQLQARPVARGGSPVTIAQQADAVIDDAREQGAELDVRFEFDQLWSGVSVDATEADVLLAAESDAVVAVYPVYVIDLPETTPGTISPFMESAVGMTGAAEAHDLGFRGEGMRIGIIDTGVDVDHPDFGGGGTPTDGLHTGWRTDQIQYGIDLVGDAYNADPSSSAYSPIPVPDGNPDDCNGHGTHVAGIAAANGDPSTGVIGVAPDAVIGAYRVFGCGGSTEADVMLSALESAFEDGMDIVNMSIGSSFMTWKQYPTAVAADAAVQAGMHVVASIGNSGADGLYSAGAPGVGDHVIGVASYDNAMVTLTSILVSPDDTPVGYVDATGAPTPPTEGTETLSRLGDPGSPEARACSPGGDDPDATGITIDLTGTAVLIQRGLCTFYEKAFNAQEAGASAVVLYNNVAGLINPTVEPPTGDDPEVTIPVILVSLDDGVMIDGRVAADETTFQWTDQTDTAPSPTGGLISSFSSYGLTAELGLKPDIGAPGGNIYSTYPLESGGNATVSGTSMASPHVAGAVALLLEARPDLTPAQVRDVLQNHADPAVWSLNPGLGFLEGAFRQGAGMLDVDDAIQSTVSIEPGKIALGEGEAGPQSVSLSITNSGSEPVTYAVANEDGTIAAGPPTAPPGPGFFLDPALVDGPEEVTVGAGETQVVDFVVTPPDSEHLLYSGWVTFTPEDGEPLRVPYAGLSGDYQGIEVLTPGALGVELPLLGQLVECDRLIGSDCMAGGVWQEYEDTGNGDEPVFTLANGDVPSALVHLAHQSRQLRLVAYEADADGNQGASLGTVVTLDYLERTATEFDFHVFTWDGTLADGSTVPGGKYILGIEVLKALGDPDDPAHTETWIGEPFTIEDASEPANSPEVSRYSGPDRYSTAARISQEYDPGVEVVYIATGASFPDALAGSALAGTLGVPVLLVAPGAIPAATQFELTRLQPQRIVVLGGSGVVSGQVLSDLRSFTEGTVERVSGLNRYETAAAIAGLYDPGVEAVYIATGTTFPDALAGGAAAGDVGGPVLLVQPNAIPAATAAQLDRLEPERIVVLGGSGAVSAAVATQLGAYAPVERLGGANRFETAVQISGGHAPGLDVVFVATGADFPDALAGAARAGHLGAPVLLVQRDQIPAATLAELLRLAPREVVILGGTGAVSQAVEDQIGQLEFGG